MLLKKIKKEGHWIFADYQATWNYGYDFMLDAAQAVIDSDLKTELERVAIGQIGMGGQTECIEEVRRAGNVLRRCGKLKEEQGVLMIAGISHVMGCPVQLMFYNQTNVIRLCIPSLYKNIFKKGGKNAFTTYLCSMEIKAYCAAAVMDKELHAESGENLSDR